MYDCDRLYYTAKQDQSLTDYTACEERFAFLPE